MAALLVLGGCGASADDTTCDEYAGMDFEDQTSKIWSLLAEHDLVEDDTSNIRSLKRRVVNFCGGPDGTVLEETTLPDNKLGDAANWSDSYWRVKDDTIRVGD